MKKPRFFYVEKIGWFSDSHKRAILGFPPSERRAVCRMLGDRRIESLWNEIALQNQVIDLRQYWALSFSRERYRFPKKRGGLMAIVGLAYRRWCQFTRFVRRGT